MLTDLKQTIIDAMDARGSGDGVFVTPVDGLSLSRVSQPVMPHHRIYKPTICVVVQGGKQIMTGDQVIDYRAAQMLVVTVERPASGAIVDASPDRPYIGLNIDFDTAVMREVMETMESPPKPRGDSVSGVFVQEFDAAIADCIRRLVGLISQPKAIPVLYPAIMRELCYWLLSGPNGSEICKLALPASHTRRMTDAIHLLRDSYAEPIRIEQLAAIARMSPSSFHQHFKVLTSMTPLQYQKNLRLLEARRLMVADGANVQSAAYRVGYESASQFSREYVRMFGAPPKRDVIDIKTLPVPAEA